MTGSYNNCVKVWNLDEKGWHLKMSLGQNMIYGKNIESNGMICEEYVSKAMRDRFK